MKWHRFVQYPYIRECCIYLTWMQHHFQRDSCAKLLQRSSGRRTTVCQNGILWETCSKWKWFSWKNVLVPICAKLPIYPDKVVSQLIAKLCNNMEKVWSRSGFVWKESWLHVRSMPSIWLKQQNNILFKKWNPSVLRQMFCKKIMVKLNFIKSVLYLFT